MSTKVGERFLSAAGYDIFLARLAIAQGYHTNPRNLEVPWKPVWDVLLREMHDEQRFDLHVRQEQPIPPPEQVANADQMISGG